MIFTLFLLTSLSLAENTASAEYTVPPLKEIVYEIPDTLLESLKVSFSKEAILPWAYIASSTAVLYKYDEDILLHTQRDGRKWGLGNKDNTETLITVGNIDVFRGPTDQGSLFYFLGDGWTHTAIAASLYTYGKYNENNRATVTGMQIVHGMFSSTVFSQALKRSTGRESPSTRTEKRGNWDFFPSYSKYSANTAKYDAFPSGHIMTATMTLTVINNNYPEYSHVILPVGISLISLLSWQMVNNGVHWASDYPLGIA
ncbi:MAG: phosphatase PAP2 family protein, partial [Bdellovibrionales bacterium]|nr:phosphatase PAP2 family protein [Bdellovibrionales bacterium]